MQNWVGKLTAVGLAGALLATGADRGQAQMPAPSADWTGKTVPASIFAEFPVIRQPRLSPDGKWIATIIRAGGGQKLAIMPVHSTDGKIEIIASSNEAASDKQDDRLVQNYHWIDPDHLIISFSSRENLGGGWFDNVRYLSYNRITKKSTAIGWDLAFGPTEELWSSHSGPPHMLLQRLPYNAHDTSDNISYELIRNPEVIDVDLDTGKYTVVMKQNAAVQDWTADSDGVVRMGSSRDAETGKVTVLYRPSADQPLKVVYSAVPDRYAQQPLPSVFLSGSDKAYATSRTEGYEALYEYDLKTMKLGPKVFGMPGYDIGGPVLTFDRKALLGVNYTSDRDHWTYFDPRMKDIQAALEKMFGAGNVLIATADAARETVIFRVAQMGQAETWYTFDTKMGVVGRFAYGNEELKDSMLNPVSVVHYPASDGKQIEAILTMPRHKTGQKNLPLVILPHGGPWARDDADWDPYGWAQAIAEQGYVVIQPNYRGSTGYGAAWEKASEHAWGYRMQDDLNDAIPWLAGQGIADPKRVCIFGWSYGGYAASRAAQRDGAKYRCAISGAGVHDLVAMQRYDRDYLGAYGAKTYMGSAGIDPVDVSPGLHPEQYSIPILIIQGAKDQRVPPSQSRDLVARLKKAGKIEGKDFVYLEQPLNTHNLLREADRMQVLTETIKFLQQHNPA